MRYEAEPRNELNRRLAQIMKIAQVLFQSGQICGSQFQHLNRRLAQMIKIAQILFSVWEIPVIRANLLFSVSAPEPQTGTDDEDCTDFIFSPGNPGNPGKSAFGFPRQ